MMDIGKGCYEYQGKSTKVRKMRVLWNDDIVAYIRLQQVCMQDLGANVCVMWAPRTLYVQLILRYAFRVKAHMDHDMVCWCTGMNCMGCMGRVLSLTHDLSF